MSKFLELIGFGGVAEFPLRIVAQYKEAYALILVVLKSILDHTAVTHGIAKGQHRPFPDLIQDGINLGRLAVLPQTLTGDDNLLIEAIIKMLICLFFAHFGGGIGKVRT